LQDSCPSGQQAIQIPLICLKHPSSSLWSDRTECGVKVFFEHWKRTCAGKLAQELPEVRANDRKTSGCIAAHHHSNRKVSLGLVAGSDNKIRAIQRTAYG